jgi:endonuclease/exonuclease/phosphatase family metal-dependent hydrolase
MRLLSIICVLALFGCSKHASSPSGPSGPLPGTVDKTDTLTVMAYNVLSYGDYCQSTPAGLDGYLRTIVGFVRPDLLSCEKMNPFPFTPGASGNLADEIVASDLPEGYAYGTPTAAPGQADVSVLFYNRQKLTYVRTQTLVRDITDFDLYTLYYNDVNLAITHDTTFLYVVVNHTQSGSSSTDRDRQVMEEATALRGMFTAFPNLIVMGDFNTRLSDEAGYQALVTSADSATLLYDPPYYPDAALTYPGNWDVTPYRYGSYLTTSTRALATVPNSCGTSGGAKSWYDHIFLSPRLVSGADSMHYVPHSYGTIGNDGNRLGVDINSTSPVVNTSAPDSVIQALFQFSNKYPVSVRVAVRAKRS